MNESDRPPLDPCPFCGGVNLEEQVDTGLNRYVVCIDCITYGPPEKLSVKFPKWNTRKGQGESPVGWSKLNPNQRIDVQRIIDSLVKLNYLTLSTDSPPRSDTNDESTKS